MKNITSFYVRTILCAAFSMSLFFNASASHIVGADLYYTNISGNNYKIIIALYGDCGASSAASFATLPYSSPQVCVYDSGTYVTTLSLALDSPASGVEVTPLCAGDSSQCSSPTSLIPGVKKFVYSFTYTLPHTSATWRFIYDGANGSGAAAGRAAAITNIASAASSEMQLIDTLNNVASANSNPTLTVSQQTYFCEGQHDTYNPGAVDPDHDSLSITLISAMEGTTSCGAVGGDVSYTGIAWPGTSVSASAPLQVDAADSFSMNTVTGDMFFHPYYQRSTVVYNIREFRSGSFVGASQREMTVLVVGCDSLFPCMYVAGSPVTGSGVTEMSEINDVEVYPNPATNELNINISDRAYSSCTITNTIGNVFYQRPLTAPQTHIDISMLPDGLYYITLKGTDGVKVQKFIKM